MFYFYSSIAGLALAVHLIINWRQLFVRQNVKSSKEATEYRFFLVFLLLFFVSDALWGLFAAWKYPRILYVDTDFFFLTMALSVGAWSRYVVAYLEMEGRPRNYMLWTGHGMLAFFIVALIANNFADSFFFFKVNDRAEYKAGHLRQLALILLAAFNAISAGLTLVRCLRTKGTLRRRNMMVFAFGITMMGAILFQLGDPFLPLYSVGCIIGCCLLHVFVIEDERDEMHRKELLAQEYEMQFKAERAASHAKSIFFSSVSHDIRTPLNAIIGYIELLIGGIDDQKEREKALSVISTSGYTLLQLINDVLDLSKLESGRMNIKPELTDVRRLVSSVLHSFDVTTMNSNVELKEQYGSLPLLEIDPQRIRQILFNLIGNAVKFTEQGEIRVKAMFKKDNGSENGVFILSVSDTGCGIADAEKDKLMTPYVQAEAKAKTKGTGLGLAICKQLATQMGGSLSFVSELGKGSTFTLELRGVKSVEHSPDVDKRIADGENLLLGRTDGENTCAGNKINGTKRNVGEYRVLIADDVPLNLAVLSALLTRIGLRDIVAAIDGQDAWEKIQASDKPFDLVLTDMWMPKMSGRDLVSKIRADERFAKLPVYAITADVEARTHAESDGFTDILLKPITLGALQTLFA